MIVNRTIILGNAPSSGSTLLVNLLGAHPDIFQTRELNIFDKPDWCACRTPDLKENWPKYKLKKYDIHHPFEHAALFNGYRTIPDFSQFGGSYAEFAVDEMKKAAHDAGCSAFAEKTPNNIFALPYLHSTLADAKFVIIVRNPISVFKSLRKRGLGTFPSVGRWYFANLVAQEMAKRSRALIVHYEKLTAAPEKETERVFQFLDMQPPSESVVDERQSAETIQLPSWTHDVRGPIKAQDVDNDLPAEMAPVFQHIRANDYFFDYVGINNPEMSPMDVAHALGYTPEEGPIRKRAHPQLYFPRHTYVRYIAGCLRHRRRIRPLWHRWE